MADVEGGWVVDYVAGGDRRAGGRGGVCAALNLAFFCTGSSPWTYRRGERPPLVLALISLGTLAESLAVVASLQMADRAPLFAPAAWVVARAITLAGTGFISALILKR